MIYFSLLYWYHFWVYSGSIETEMAIKKLKKIIFCELKKKMI